MSDWLSPREQNINTVPCYRGGKCGSRTHRTNSKAFYECLRLMNKEEAEKPPKQAFALVSNKQSDLDALEPRGTGIFTNSNMAPCTSLGITGGTWRPSSAKRLT